MKRNNYVWHKVVINFSKSYI